MKAGRAEVQAGRGYGRWRLAAAALALLVGQGAAYAQDPAQVVLPVPQQQRWLVQALDLPSGSVVSYPDGDRQAAFTANYLVDQMVRRQGMSWRARASERAGKEHSGVVLRLDRGSPDIRPEGYQMRIDDQAVVIRARDEAGLLHGVVTLSQLAGASAGKDGIHLRQGTINDWPSYRWRGLMVDSVRHFQSPEELRRLIDAMVQLKLDVLHWHLSDDQGWRIEIKRYPQLTATGAWRRPPHAGQDGEPERYGGYYTQDEIRALVAYAAARQITLMPELDLPGHAQAAVASYPALGVTGRQTSVGVDWGVNPWLYSPGPQAIVFLEQVLDEVLTLFPSRYIDLGGDEAVKGQWQASATVQAQRRRLGLSSEDALQGWMMGQLAGYLSQHGRKLVGWDEILQGDHVPADATVMSWRGTQGAIAAARAGHDVILSPSPDLYLDQLQSANPDELSGRAPVRSLAQVYAFQVTPAGLDAAQAAHVLGAQANVWTEHLPTRQHLEHAIFPRLDALAEVLWSGSARHDWTGFLDRLSWQLARDRQAGLGDADTAFEPVPVYDRDQVPGHEQLQLGLKNQAGYGTFHYTLDGSEPGPQSPLYRAPFDVTLPARLAVATLDGHGRPLAAVRRFELDVGALLRLDSSQLSQCRGPDNYLRLLPQSDAASLHPVYDVNLFDGCWIYPTLRLDRIGAISVDIGRLPRNYALAGDADKVVRHPPGSRFGQIQVFLDTCQGEPLLRLALRDPAASPFRYVLRGRLPALQGRHALCLRSTAPVEGALYGLAHVGLQLRPKTP